MKIVIDIDEKEYKRIINGDWIGNQMAEIFENGTVLPDNPTNGAVICLLYPNLRYVIQNGRVVTTIGVASSFDLDWWNAPYRKDGEIYEN